MNKIAPGKDLAAETAMQRLPRVAERDWENSHQVDLSDEGLRADLEKRASSKAGASKLVLDVDDDEHPRVNHKQHSKHDKDNHDKK